VAEVGRPIKELCRSYSMSDTTFYRWHSKYGDMDSSDIRKMKELEKENQKLKQMFAKLSLENTARKDLIEKKL